jgi:hypothetical protein
MAVFKSYYSFFLDRLMSFETAPEAAAVSRACSASTNAFRLVRLACQKTRYCCNQESTAFKGSGLSWYNRCRPSRFSCTRWARRSRRRCLEIAGRETGNARAICPAGWTPCRNRSSTARRVGSERAWKAASVEYVTERFRIMRNHSVTYRRMSRGKGERTSGGCRRSISGDRY